MRLSKRALSPRPTPPRSYLQAWSSELTTSSQGKLQMGPYDLQPPALAEQAVDSALSKVWPPGENPDLREAAASSLLTLHNTLVSKCLRAFLEDTAACLHAACQEGFVRRAVCSDVELSMPPGIVIESPTSMPPGMVMESPMAEQTPVEPAFKTAQKARLRSRTFEVQEQAKRASAEILEEEILAMAPCQQTRVSTYLEADPAETLSKNPAPRARTDNLRHAASAPDKRKKEAPRIARRDVGDARFPAKRKSRAAFASSDQEPRLPDFDENTKKHHGIFGSKETNSDDTQRRHAVFPDKQAMAAMVVAGCAEESYNVCDYYKRDGWAQWLARSPWFESIVLCVISLNALYIAVDADYNTSPVLVRAPTIFQAAENSFCIFFVLELAIRYCAFVRSVDAFSDAWFCFDSIMVVLLVVDTWVFSLVYLLMYDANDDSAVGNTTLLRLLRLLRLSRSLRMVKLMQAIPELLIMIKGIAAASRSVFFTLCLLAVVIYVFGIAFRLLTNGTELGSTHFPSVPGSMASLLLFGTLPDMAPIVEACSAENILLGALVLTFILVGSLTVMNMLVGVLVEVVSVVAALEKEQMDAAFVKSSLLGILDAQGIDISETKNVSKTEFEAVVLSPDAARVLGEVGVDVVGLVDFVDFIFDEVATDDELSFASLLELILQLRGTNTATVRDIVDLRRFVSQSAKQLQEQLSHIARGVSTLPAGVEDSTTKIRAHY
eukprot:TRINITY_DN6068_c0_g1_i1.p1 TRINITY_DN6068_c0_g1~~TRINITY_DN6068_c0_g1_i1.p1  ORF type:complete len:721 (+),score=112.40 TRINITY_DN6068_c0_g1_i1:127-2289(+)